MDYPLSTTIVRNHRTLELSSSEVYGWREKLHLVETFSAINLNESIFILARISNSQNLVAYLIDAKSKNPEFKRLQLVVPEDS